MSSRAAHLPPPRRLLAIVTLAHSCLSAHCITLFGPRIITCHLPPGSAAAATFSLTFSLTFTLHFTLSLTLTTAGLRCSCGYAMDWLRDSDCFQEALRAEPNQTYLDSLTGSMSMVLDEFYQ